MAGRDRGADAGVPQRSHDAGADRGHEGAEPSCRAGVRSRAQRHPLGETETQARPMTVLRAPTLIREDRTQRWKCCVSSSSIRSHSSQVRVSPFVSAFGRQLFGETSASRHERSFHNRALSEPLEPALRDFYGAPGLLARFLRLGFAGSNRGLTTTETDIR
jgi:hypothetical protein